MTVRRNEAAWFALLTCFAVSARHGYKLSIPNDVGSKGKKEGGWKMEKVRAASAVCMQKSRRAGKGAAGREHPLALYDCIKVADEAMVSEDGILMQLEGRKCQIKWRVLASKISPEETSCTISHKR
jgi:hypothetical protein